MLIDKTKLGVSFFDAHFGGIYRGRSVLCVGRHGSGKSLLACQFVNQALQDGDKALLLSKHKAHDTIIVGESQGFSFTNAVDRGDLTLLEYNIFIPESNASTNILLPPQVFMELQEIIEEKSIRRIVFDTVLPWVAIHPVSRLAEHVSSFVHAVERLGVTALFNLPKPVSNAAHMLKGRLEDQCPIVINLNHENSANRVLSVTKYLGESQNICPAFPFEIASKSGFQALVPPGGKTPPPVVSQPARFAAAVRVSR